MNLDEFLKDSANVAGVSRVLTLARLSSQSLVLSNKVGAIIVNLASSDVIVGCNYTYGALEKYKGSDKYATLANIGLYDTDDDLEFNEHHIHAVSRVVEKLVENYNDFIYQDINFDVLEESFDELILPDLQKDTIEELSEANSKARKIIKERLDNIDDYTRKLEDLLEDLSKKLPINTLACFTTKRPCKECEEKLIENKVNYLAYLEQGVFKTFELCGGQYVFIGTNTEIQIY